MQPQLLAATFVPSASAVGDTCGVLYVVGRNERELLAAENWQSALRDDPCWIHSVTAWYDLATGSELFDGVVLELGFPTLVEGARWHVLQTGVQGYGQRVAFSPGLPVASPCGVGVLIRYPCVRTDGRINIRAIVEHRKVVL